MNELTKNFINDLKSIEGKECWGFVPSVAIGTAILLEIGDKIPRKNVVKNKYLTKEQRENTSEFIFLVYCSWRLDSKHEVICGAYDSSVKNGTMIRGLQSVVGKKILSVHYLLPAYDLVIEFDNNFTLKIFCDQTNDVDVAENYFFYTKNIIYKVEIRSLLSFENRTF